MARQSNLKKLWEENIKKAETMCAEFVEAIQKLDMYKPWEELMIEAMISGGSEHTTNEIIEALHYNADGIYVVKYDSIVQQMRFEAFKEEMERNPYQLNLIP